MVFTAIGKSNAPLKRMFGLEPRLKKVTYKSNDVFHLTLPPVIPTNWINDPGEFDKRIEVESGKIERTVKRAMSEIGMQNPIIVNAFNPIIGDSLVGKFNEDLLLYYCYDEIAAAEWCKVHGSRKEASFMKKVDGIITTSEALQSSKSKYNSNTFLVKNGVDITLFELAFNPNINTHNPTIGYIGSVDNRLDYDLLEYVIKAYPSYSFQFVGRGYFSQG